jgi:MOSC domain-containing protein YiiM
VSHAATLVDVTGSVVQINISRGGVPKLPIPEGNVRVLGLEGDHHAHPQFHGGPRQALLLICAEVIDRLKDEGFPLYYGALGENITTRGLDHRELRVGQQFRIGPEVWIELTKPRAPCKQLDVYGAVAIQKALYDKQVKAGDPTAPHWGMSGLYASIVRPGSIRVGDTITLVGEVA